jgi:enoyl-CoA hydratase/carnithine racemase
MNFNYSTLNVSLCPKTRSVRVALNRPENQNTINIEMLFELESLFGWLTTHLEVKAVVLTGEGDTFSAGFDQEELKIMSEEKMQKYLIRFQKIIAGMLSLPQTIICDLKNGAAGMGIELSSGADVRIMRSSGKLEFNSLKKGWVPCSGGVGLLGFWVGHAKARSWTLCSSTIDGAEALNSGYCLSSYANAEDALTPLLTNIAAQAAVARIQTKRSFLEAIMPELTRSFEYETIFSFAALKTQDWKKDQESEDFIAARDMAKLLKDSAQAPVL